MHEAHFSIGLCSAHYFFLFFFTFLPFRASSLFAASAERRMVGQKNAKGNRFWSITIEIFQHFARFVSRFARSFVFEYNPSWLGKW